MPPIAAQMLAQRLGRPMQMPGQMPPGMQMPGGPGQMGNPNPDNPPIFFGGQWVHPQDPRYPLIRAMILQKYQKGGAYGR